MMVWYDDQSSEEPQDRTIQMKLICTGLWGPEMRQCGNAHYLTHNLLNLSLHCNQRLVLLLNLFGTSTFKSLYSLSSTLFD